MNPILLGTVAATALAAWWYGNKQQTLAIPGVPAPPPAPAAPSTPATTQAMLQKLLDAVSNFQMPTFQPPALNGQAPITINPAAPIQAKLPDGVSGQVTAPMSLPVLNGYPGGLPPGLLAPPGWIPPTAPAPAAPPVNVKLPSLSGGTPG